MVHTQIVKTGYEEYPVVKTGLINAYSKFEAGGLRVALKLFDEMSERNVVTWTAMIFGYTRSGEMESDVELFERMPDKDIPPWRNVVTWTAMVSGYTRSGEIESNVELFERMPDKHFISHWWRNPYFFSRNTTRVICNPTSAFRSVDASSDQARHKKLMWDELLPRLEADKIRMMHKQLKKSDIGTLEQRLHQNVCWLIQVAYFIFLGAIHEHLFRVLIDISSLEIMFYLSTIRHNPCALRLQTA
ncbi:pentatricopeptide repeat-containing protein [Tanacetum coccineum]